jgi:hypothetical protein
MQMTINGREFRGDSAWVAPRPAKKYFKARPKGLQVWPPGCDSFFVPLTEDTPEGRQACINEARDIFRSLFDRRAAS